MVLNVCSENPRVQGCPIRKDFSMNVYHTFSPLLENDSVFNSNTDMPYVTLLTVGLQVEDRVSSGFW